MDKGRSSIGIGVSNVLALKGFSSYKVTLKLSGSPQLKPPGDTARKGGKLKLVRGLGGLLSTRRTGMRRKTNESAIAAHIDISSPAQQ